MCVFIMCNLSSHRDAQPSECIALLCLLCRPFPVAASGPKKCFVLFCFLIKTLIVGLSDVHYDVYLSIYLRHTEISFLKFL